MSKNFCFHVLPEVALFGFLNFLPVECHYKYILHIFARFTLKRHISLLGQFHRHHCLPWVTTEIHLALQPGPASPQSLKTPKHLPHGASTFFHPFNSDCLKVLYVVYWYHWDLKAGLFKKPYICSHIWYCGNNLYPTWSFPSL